MEEILRQAERLEKDYDWLGAAESYEKALKLLPQDDFSKKGKINERLGYAFFRAACQADSVEAFKKRICLSAESYEKAAELCKKTQPATSLYCMAMARYSNSWVVDGASQKRELLEDSWRLIKEAFASFKASEDRMGCVRVFKDLYFCLKARDELVGAWDERKRIAEDAVKYGLDTVSMLSEGLDREESAWVYVLTSLSMSWWLDFFDERRAEFVSLISSYMEKAAELAEQTEDAYLVFFRNYTMSLPSDFSKLSLPKGLGCSEEALRSGKKSRDHYLIGLGHHMMLVTLDLEARTLEDPEELKEKNKQIIRHGEESISNYLLVCKYRLIAMCYACVISTHQHSASHETDVARKRALLEQAVRVGLKGSEYANLSGSLEAMADIFHALSRAEFFLSKTESDPREKRRLLEEASTLRKKTVEIGYQLNRPEDWNNGVYQYNMALINADLAQVEESGEKRKDLLEEAVQGMERCLHICTEDLMVGHAVPLPSSFGTLGLYYDMFGQVLSQFYSLTKDENVIGRSIQVYESAAKIFQKAGMPSRVAEAYWKAAKLYDFLGEYTRAAESFEEASRDYSVVSEKIPQLKEFYHDHSVYMQAWCEIEKARYHHERQDYGLAKEHFEKASVLHESLRQWSYLASNYSAWAELGQAEELSRREKAEEAVKSFEKAAKLFTETEDSLRARLAKIEDADEKQMATSIINATGPRSKYCLARTALEEAKILDKEGDHFRSSSKYGVAAETFEKIYQTLESEQQRKEFRYIISLSRAWQKMMLGDAKASPELYSEASTLFEQASKESSVGTAGLLALGHSRFCKALEAGTRFEDSRDASLHTLATQHLEIAANYYLKAGFKSASDYAKATGLLLDAYVHMDNAKKEADPEKKARLYAMAEKVLQTSAGSFTKAEHPEKTEQVQRLLEKVKEERELALSLTEVLHTPSIVSTTTAFATPTPNQENAVGLERFENADIQANLIIRQKELKVGENLSIELELVNAGKGFALLTKVTEIIPGGFEVAENPENFRVEDSYINLKGKRLDPLKTEDVRLVLKPQVQGTFALKPTILYLDENGKYKSHELETVTVIVKELGIKGWLKGER